MELIKHTFGAFESLEENSGRLAKEFIIEQERDNEIFKELLELAYNPFRIYHLKKFDPIESSDKFDLIQNYAAFKRLLVDLEARLISGNLAIERAQYCFSHMTNIERKWYLRVLQKDLNVGVQAKTINKIIPGLIPVFDVMLAQPFRSYPDRFILQPKYDGMRIIANTTTGELFSRKGKRVEGFDLIEKEIKNKFTNGMMLDGELLAGAKGKKIHSFNNLMQQAFKKESGKQGILYAFDFFGDEDQLTRTRKLEQLLLDTPSFTVKKTPTSGVITRDTAHLVESFYKKCLEDGFEGLILKDVDASYEFKRSYSWQKVKPVQTYDLKVIGIESGGADTKYQELVGALVVDFNGQEVRVGSGLTDQQRLDWVLLPNRIIGKTIEVMAQEETSNKQGTTSLRFPRFKRIREDK